MKGKQNEKDFSDFIKPGFGDLHDSCDCVCGCYAAASERGTSYSGQTKTKMEKKAVSLPRSGSRRGRME